MQLPDRIRLPFTFDPAGLLQDLEYAERTADFRRHASRDVYEGDWSVCPLRCAAYAKHPAHMIYADPFATEFRDLPILDDCPHFREAIAAFQAAPRVVRLNRLAAGAVIKEHEDREIHFDNAVVRIHIPVLTSPAVDFRLNGTQVVMPAGSAWYLRLSDPHSVTNRSDQARVHIVADFTVNDWMLDLFRSSAASVS